MRKLVIVLVLMFCSVSQSQAMIFEPEITNVAESSENSPGLGFFIPTKYTNRSVEIISDGWYAWGTAFEFNLEEDMIIHSIMSPIAVSRGLDGHTPVPGTWNMTLALYSGSTSQYRGEILPDGQAVPLVSNAPLIEDFIAHGGDLMPLGSPLGRVYTYQGVEDLNLALPAGKYWATYFDGSVVTYVQPKVRLEGTVSTPEPATMLLMGGGLAGMYWRRRRTV